MGTSFGGGGKVFGIDLKKDWDAILLGIAAMFALLVIPGVSDFVYNKIVVPVRQMFVKK